MSARGESNLGRKSASGPSADHSSENRSGQRESLGLCADCAHSRTVEAKRGARFYLCGLSVTDPAFLKYPRLPVLKCSGYKVKE